MKNYLIALFSLTCLYGIAQPPPSKDVDVEIVETTSEGMIFSVVEQMPQFPGGETELLKYLGKNTKYPEKARDCGCSGTVYLSFVIDEEGTILDPSVIRSPKPCEEVTYDKEGNKMVTQITEGPCAESGKLMADESLRVLKSMPKWQPGKQNGKSVRVQYNLPIKFTLR